MTVLFMKWKWAYIGFGILACFFLGILSVAFYWIVFGGLPKDDALINANIGQRSSYERIAEIIWKSPYCVCITRNDCYPKLEVMCLTKSELHEVRVALDELGLQSVRSYPDKIVFFDWERGRYINKGVCLVAPSFMESERKYVYKSLDDLSPIIAKRSPNLNGIVYHRIDESWYVYVQFSD